MYNGCMTNRKKWSSAVGKNAQGQWAPFAPQQLAFTTREARDAEYARLKAEGLKPHKLTTQQDKKMLWVVAWSEPIQTPAKEEIVST